MDSVLLDTSFCIRLIKQDDPLHQNGVNYFEYFLENKITVFLSSIAVAQYSVKDDAVHLPLKAMKIIPFDFFDGQVAGEFYAILLNRREDLKDIERNIIKDDCKLLAQIFNRKIDAYITKDKKSFSQIIQPVKQVKGFPLELLDFSIPLNEYESKLF